jgi:hypothetical protein
MTLHQKLLIIIKRILQSNLPVQGNRYALYVILVTQISYLVFKPLFLRFSLLIGCLYTFRSCRSHARQEIPESACIASAESYSILVILNA